MLLPLIYGWTAAVQTSGLIHDHGNVYAWRGRRLGVAGRLVLGAWRTILGGGVLSSFGGVPSEGGCLLRKSSSAVAVASRRTYPHTTRVMGSSWIAGTSAKPFPNVRSAISRSSTKPDRDECSTSIKVLATFSITFEFGLLLRVGTGGKETPCKPAWATCAPFRRVRCLTRIHAHIA